MYSNRIFALIITILISLGLSAQNQTDADKLMLLHKYEDAKPIYEKLLKTRPSDGNLNLKYGICLFRLNNPAAEKYLKTAATRKVAVANEYLGDINFRNYYFDEALKYYETFLSSIKNNDSLASLIHTKTERAKAGQRMMRGVEDIRIVDSIQINKKDFLLAYRLHPENGELFDCATFFNDPHKAGDTGFLSERKDRIHFADTKNNKTNLFTSYKMLDSWSAPVSFSEEINSDANENYPFVLPDGITVYFASDRTSSLGGYDIYMTRYNQSSGKYLNPENIGMPFNSPYNDYLMVIDEVNQIGWFASDRYQPEGKVVVYTFIPNVYKKILETDDKDVIRGVAMLQNLKIDNKYRLNRLNNKTEQTLTPDSQPEFEFWVHDHSPYGSLSDFKSENAKKFFLQAQQAEQELEQLNSRLEDKRVEYDTAVNKTSVKTQILELEKKILSLQDEPSRLYRQAWEIERKRK